MPRLAASGTKGLYKNHTRDCGRTAADNPTKCDCAWSGKHKGKSKVLAEWTGKAIDPRTKEAAKSALLRFQAAIDRKEYDPTGERPETQGTETTLAAFAREWMTHYVEENNLTSPSWAAMVNVVTGKQSRLATMSLKHLAGATEDITKWLNDTGRARAWKAKTWNGYRDMLGLVFQLAVQWKRMGANPVPGIKRKVAMQPEHFKRRVLLEDVEDQLFAVVDELNTPRPRSTRGKLTQADADAIRVALATGQTGKLVAQRFKVSPAVVSAIKHGDIWKGAAEVLGTKGTEMRRRLIAAFDLGLRAGEMLQVQLQHVNWRPVTVTTKEGKTIQGYVITLPPEITKGGKTTGTPEEVFAFTPRAVALLEARRFALKNNPASKQFIFGTEDGRRQKSFQKMWSALFTLAGLTFGRDEGLVWHTIRHEFISRLAENTGDPVLTQKLARHKRLETTQGYFHARQDRAYAAAAGLAR